MTNAEIVRRVAIALEENSAECNWKSRRQTISIARVAIDAMKEIEAEIASERLLCRDLPISDAVAGD